jgi:cytochrome c oxidase assembly protein subunit 11
MFVWLINKNNRLLFYITILVFTMIGLAFASVPLYDLFCRVTGYGGTTQKSKLAPGSNGKYRNIQIRFDANISNELNWQFLAPQKELIVQPGIQEIVYYTAKNLSDKPTTGSAAYNVSPPKAGSVFMKVDCFCFVEQTIQPGEEIKMPVSFYVDPSIEDDKNLQNLSEITLSYTFFKIDDK